MVVKIDRYDDVAVLIPSGNLVASEKDSFNLQLEQEVYNNFSFVLLDMTRINFMDSSGLDAVMAINKHATNAGGIFACAAPHENVLKVFRITWADHKIPIAATISEGLQMIRDLRDNQG